MMNKDLEVKQGLRTDLTSSQSETKLRTDEEVAEKKDINYMELMEKIREEDRKNSIID